MFRGCRGLAWRAPERWNAPGRRSAPGYRESPEVPKGRCGTFGTVVRRGGRRRDGRYVGARPAGHTSRRAVAQRVSSCRLESWSLRSTAETCDSTVFTEMNNCFAISLYA